MSLAVVVEVAVSAAVIGTGISGVVGVARYRRSVRDKTGSRVGGWSETLDHDKGHSIPGAGLDVLSELKVLSGGANPGVSPAPGGVHDGQSPLRSPGAFGPASIEPPVDPLARLRMWRDFQTQARHLRRSTAFSVADVPTWPAAAASMGNPDINRTANRTVDRTANRPIGRTVNPTIKLERKRSGGVARPVQPRRLPVDRPRLQLLGLIKVEGAEKRLTAQQTALVALLTLRGPLAKDQVVDALWDGRLVSVSRYANLMAEVRASLGRSCLVHDEDGRYRISNIESDVDLLQNALESFAPGAGIDGNDAARLRNALALITGTIFTRRGSRYWRWLDDDYHHIARVQGLVTTATLKLVDAAERQERWTEAQWACEQGLMAVPGDEALVDRLSDLYASLGRHRLAERLSGDGGSRE